MLATDYSLFPTRLLAVQFPDTAALDGQLLTLVRGRADAADFNMHPDALNLLHLADAHPEIAKVRDLFLTGLRRWLAAEGVNEVQSVEMVMFSSYSQRGEMTLVHNHNADLVGIYYASTPVHDRPGVFQPGLDGEDEYFATEDGVLLLHDPRFNANLAAVRSRDYAKVYPRPGLMLIFPGYLWHSVTPHQGDAPRLALSVNFTLKWPGEGRAVEVRIED